MNVSVLLVGCGEFGRRHIRRIFEESRSAVVAGLIEVSEEQRRRTRALFEELQLPCPPFFDTIGDFVAAGARADTAVIVTPHNLHLPHTLACFTAGMDVLLEKPMVMTAADARRMIRARDRSGRTLVVAFPGSIAPQLRRAQRWIHEGRIGRVTSIVADLEEPWKERNRGTWRQNPALSGGGYLFDTGTHVMNSVLHLVGEDIAQLQARFDNAGTPVDVVATVTGRFHGGASFAWLFNGDAAHWNSRILLAGDGGEIETNAWGSRLRIRTRKKPDWVEVPPPRSTPSLWKTFLRVRAGRVANPCPAESGLRLARVMDDIRRSAASSRQVRRRDGGRR